MLLSMAVFGDTKEDLGLNDLANELGVSLPNGSGIAVFQIEAKLGDDTWLADAATGEFAGKTITALSSVASPGFSGHAVNVGRRFYGIANSISLGITDIGAHSTDGWFFDELNLNTTSYPAPTVRRVANHSYVGTGFQDGGGVFSPSLTALVLKVNDWFSDVDELMQVYSPNNNNLRLTTASTVLMATSFNGLVVGVSDFTHGEKVIQLDATYVADRVAINVVVPQSLTSFSAPFGSSAVALLMSAAQANHDWSDGSVTTRAGTIVQNAERIETVKAVLMAGALRQTLNSTTTGDVQGYRSLVSHQTNNGLDWRYGAGQINVFNSYHILAASEHASAEDAGIGSIGFAGFDHDDAFGGLSGTNAVGTYHLGVNPELRNFAVSLVWNLSVVGSPNQFTPFDDTASLYDLNLELIDLTAGGNVVASSESLIDNTENIWFALQPDREYELRVSKAVTQANFNWDYSIAWQATEFVELNIPFPNWAMLILAGFLLTSGQLIKITRRTQ